MQRFFKDFESLNRFSLSLDYHQTELQCAHCFKSDQFISHGVVYKQRSMLVSEKVGKRLLCSNRYGRSGCGRTFQLYICSEVPRFRYGTAHLFLFITAMLAGLSVNQSYLKAIDQPSIEPRQAWRWLQKLTAKLGDYRTALKARLIHNAVAACYRTRRFQLLLPTLAHFIANSAGCFCATFQYQSQNTFF